MVTIHEKILGKTLLELLVKLGVVREDACPTEVKLVAITEDYINSANLTSDMHSDSKGRGLKTMGDILREAINDK